MPVTVPTGSHCVVVDDDVLEWVVPIRVSSTRTVGRWRLGCVEPFSADLAGRTVGVTSFAGADLVRKPSDPHRKASDEPAALPEAADRVTPLRRLRFRWTMLDGHLTPDFALRGRRCRTPAEYRDRSGSNDLRGAEGNPTRTGACVGTPHRLGG